MVKDLKQSKPGQWYSKLKRMSNHDQIKQQEINVQSFVGIPDIEQVELIADKFAKISQEYEPLDNSTFHYSLFSSYDVTSRGPEVHPYLVYKYMTVIGLADQGHNHLKPLV